MPFWLMFMPLLAIGRAILTVFVAFGQWVTGNYYTVVPADGGSPGRIEYFHQSPDGAVSQIRISLADGRTFVASLDSDTRPSPIEILAAEPHDDSIAPYGVPFALRLTGEHQDWMDCRFTVLSGSSTLRQNVGTCVTDTGHSFHIVQDEPSQTHS
jgi:hypothetical protein